MKKIFKLSYLGLSALLLAGTGCLKDELVEDGLAGPEIYKSPKVIELPGAVNEDTRVTTYTFSFDLSEKDTTIDLVPVRLSSNSPATEDIQVQLELVPDLVSIYNDTTGSNVEQPSANNYKFSDNLMVTIPKGSREGFLKMTAKPSSLLGGSFGFGFRIKSVTNSDYVISGNYSNAVVLVGVKNIYEDDYKGIGFFQHPTVPRDFDHDKYLTTVNATTSESELGDLGINIRITVNPDNTVKIGPGSGTSGTTALVAEMPGDPVYNNKYDPATKTFKLKYGYPMPSPTRIVTETLTRQ